jgi:hypothetical protein
MLPDPKHLRWVVLVGGFTGDGSSEHSLFRTDTGNGDPRVPIFTSQAAAESYVLEHHGGDFCLIAEVIVETGAATELTYHKTGRRIIAIQAGPNA